MVTIYPTIFTPIPEGYLAYVPDLEINTHGTDLANAIEMTRDAIGIWAVCRQDDGNSLPSASDITHIKPKNNSDIVSLVDTDIDEYRRSLDNRSVKKTLTIPNWLNVRAEKEGINFSHTLQEAIKERLHIN